MRKIGTVIVMVLLCAIFYGLGRPQTQVISLPVQNNTPLPTPQESKEVIAIATKTPLAKADISLPLSGVVIVLDPGHGGYDQGCQGATGTLEAPVNLSVSLLLRDELIRYGAQVVLTREVDSSLVDPGASGNRKKQDMALRREVIEDAGAHMVLSIHMNYNNSSKFSGPQVYYRENSAEGQALAKTIQDAFLEIAPNNIRRHAVGDFYMLNIREASALVECGFLSNPTEESLLTTTQYQQDVARVIAQGVVAYWATGQES